MCIRDRSSEQIICSRSFFCSFIHTFYSNSILDILSSFCVPRQLHLILSTIDICYSFNRYYFHSSLYGNQNGIKSKFCIWSVCANWRFDCHMWLSIRNFTGKQIICGFLERKEIFRERVFSELYQTLVINNNKSERVILNSSKSSLWLRQV